MPVSTTSTRNVMCSDAISLFLWFSGGETTTTTYEFANMCVCFTTTCEEDVHDG